MNVYVYPTDHDWFRFLRARSPVDEVNFWQPGGTTLFTRLDPGELFIFRLKHPIKKIAGGGIFRHSTLFPLKLAWDSFGENNGVPDFSSFFSSINRYRAKQSNQELSINTNIGCIILQQPFFSQKTSGSTFQQSIIPTWFKESASISAHRGQARASLHGLHQNFRQSCRPT
jgi:putative restriction endonuclease